MVNRGKLWLSMTIYAIKNAENHGLTLRNKDLNTIWEQEVAGSNPVTPISIDKEWTRPFVT